MSTTADLDAMAAHRFVSVASRKRDGTMVPSVVNIAGDQGRAFFRTWEESGKAKRLRNFPEATLTPCDGKGRLTGTPVEFRCMRCAGADNDIAKRTINKRYPFLFRVIVPTWHFFMRVTTIHFEVLPTDPSRKRQ